MKSPFENQRTKAFQALFTILSMDGIKDATITLNSDTLEIHWRGGSYKISASDVGKMWFDKRGARSNRPYAVKILKDSTKNICSIIVDEKDKKNCATYGMTIANFLRMVLRNKRINKNSKNTIQIGDDNDIALSISIVLYFLIAAMISYFLGILEIKTNIREFSLNEFVHIAGYIVVAWVAFLYLRPPRKVTKLTDLRGVLPPSVNLI
jgi:hypothetical protein